MNIEINIKKFKVNVEGIYIDDYTEKYEKNREYFSEHFIDFSCLSELKGDKSLLEMSFQDTKKELV